MSSLSAIILVVLLLLYAVLIETILIKIGRRQGEDIHMSLAIRTASNLHHAVTLIVLAALIVMTIPTPDTFGLAANAQNSLITSALITLALPLPAATIGIAAATHIKSAATQWSFIGILWLVSVGLLFLHVSYSLSVFATIGN